jgi:hypothetical protein
VPVVAATEIVVVTGERYEVGGSPEEVEASILAASRGSIMQFVWLTETGTSRPLALNPDHVVSLKPTEPAP